MRRGLAKYPGGKSYLAPWLISHFPPHRVYVEAFCGGCSVLLRKERSEIEVVNDLDHRTCAIVETMRDEPEAFQSALHNIPYSEESFRRALWAVEIGMFKSKFNIAKIEYVLRRMSRGGLKKHFAWSERSRGGKPGDQNAWETALDMIPEQSARLRDVMVLNRDFRDILRIFTYPDQFLYLDPPYLPETRVTKDAYSHEMRRQDHDEMLDLCLASGAKIMISGYDSELYGEKLSSWRKFSKAVPNHAGQGKQKQRRTEVIWVNYGDKPYELREECFACENSVEVERFVYGTVCKKCGSPTRYIIRREPTPNPTSEYYNPQKSARDVFGRADQVLDAMPSWKQHVLMTTLNTLK